MTEAQTLTKARLLSAVPQLFVAGIAASCRFFVYKLGFQQAFVWGDPPSYAQVFRDGARLNLRRLDAPAFDAQRRDAEALLSASIAVDDAASLFAEYQAAGVSFAQPLKREPWGAETFIVRDPDGNLILFAG